ncbi:MAG: HupE / UreJ protein, partial [Gammaproteobacteria bacterium]|nr:HupE / UreJ protein [Gammaproteobacteria bacterium]
MSRFSLLLCGMLLLFSLASTVYADEFRPAYLQLTQIDATTYDVLWKIPALDENTTLRIQPEFPTGTEMRGAVSSTYANGAAVQRWHINVAGGLAGKTVTFSGLAVTRIDVLVRVMRLDGTTQLGRVLPFEARFQITASPGAFEVVQTYSVLGIGHILTGFDHLLFVLALLILVNGKRRLIATITAFTLAHSITLALATLGFMHVPGKPVEAMIALSIVFVATEIIHARQGKPGLTQRYPWMVAFTFGLLHGLGFAGALAEVGLPPLSIPIALLFRDRSAVVHRSGVRRHCAGTVVRPGHAHAAAGLAVVDSAVCDWRRRELLGIRARRGVLKCQPHGTSSEISK